MRCAPRKQQATAIPVINVPDMQADAIIARRFVVKGRVQGVWFRDSTRREAEQLGITGHAINLADGDVEVHANGDAESLDALAAWLHKGPPMARVDAVLSADAEPDGAGEFSIA